MVGEGGGKLAYITLFIPKIVIAVKKAQMIRCLR